MLKNILRIPCDIFYDQKWYDKCLDYCLEHISSLDEIIFFTQLSHATRNPQDICRRLEFIGALMSRLRGRKVKLGIDVLCTIGQLNEFPDQSLEKYDFLSVRMESVFQPVSARPPQKPWSTFDRCIPAPPNRTLTLFGLMTTFTMGRIAAVSTASSSCPSVALFLMRVAGYSPKIAFVRSYPSLNALSMRSIPASAWAG